MARRGDDGNHAAVAVARPLGVVPASTRGRLLLAFGLGNVLLIFLAVWDLVGNDSRMVVGVLPLTILWVFAACALNNVLAVAVYLLQAKPWADTVEPGPGAAPKGARP